MWVEKESDSLGEYGQWLMGIRKAMGKYDGFGWTGLVMDVGECIEAQSTRLFHHFGYGHTERLFSYQNPTS